METKKLSENPHRHAITFITDTLRTVITSKIELHELESLVELNWKNTMKTPSYLFLYFHHHPIGCNKGILKYYLGCSFCFFPFRYSFIRFRVEMNKG